MFDILIYNHQLDHLFHQVLILIYHFFDKKNRISILKIVNCEITKDDNNGFIFLIDRIYIFNYFNNLKEFLI